jgi:hypothetical protein
MHEAEGGALAPGRRPWIAFGICALASLVPLWSAKYLPMVDLPQHAALVSAWLHYDDPEMRFADQFEIHLFTPYVLTYLAAVWMARLVGVLAALKILVSVAVVGLPLAMMRHLARRGGDPWWALWGFPLSFGLSFRWGFVSYIVAAPLCVLFVDEGDRYAREPSRRRAVALAVLGVVLFFTHLLVLAQAVVIVAVLVLLRAPDLRRAVVRLAPLAAPIVLAALWAALAAGSDPKVRDWEWGFRWSRLTMMPALLFDAPWPPDLSVPVIDHLAAALALVLAVAVTLARPAPARDAAAWVPFTVTFGLYLLGPSNAFSSVMVSDRFALFLVPFALSALGAGVDPGPRRASRALTVAAALAAMALLTVSFRGFDAVEMAPVDRLSRLVARGRRLVTLVFVPGSEFAPGPPVLAHVGGWTQAEKGGTFATNFGSHVNLPVQYRPGREPPHSEGIQWNPGRFDWLVDGQADYFLVRSRDTPSALFQSATDPVVLVGRDEDWWLFRRLASPDAP